MKGTVGNGKLIVWNIFQDMVMSVKLRREQTSVAWPVKHILWHRQPNHRPRRSWRQYDIFRCVSKYDEFHCFADFKLNDAVYLQDYRPFRARVNFVAQYVLVSVERREGSRAHFKDKHFWLKQNIYTTEGSVWIIYIWLVLRYCGSGVQFTISNNISNWFYNAHLFSNFRTY